MATKFGFSLLCACLLIASSVSGQIDFERFLNDSNNPFINLHEYTDVKFAWNMPGRLQLLVNEGLNALKEDHPEQAILNFDSALIRDNTLWMVFYYRGVSHKALGHFPAAEADFKEVIRLKPDAAEAYLGLGVISILTKHQAIAWTYLRKSIEVNPSLTEGYYFQGTLALIQDDLRKAGRLFAKCSEINPRYAPSLLMEALLKIRSRTKENHIALFSKAIAADSAYSQTWFWRGLVYIRLEQFDNALNDWNRMLIFKPNDPFLLTMRGELHTVMGNYDKAFSDLRKALEAHEVEEDRFTLGRTALNSKLDLQFAAKYLIRNGYGLDPRSFTGLKKGFCLLLANRPRAAIKSIQESEGIEPSASVYFLKGVAFDQIPIYDSAYLWYNKALALDNDIFDAHKKRGYYRSVLGDFKGAFADLNEMIRLQPSSPLVYRLRGEIKFNYKEYYGTIIDLTRFLNSDSTNTEVLTIRAIARANVKDIKGANEDLLLAYEINSDTLLFCRIGDNYLLLADTLNSLKSYQFADSRKHHSVNGYIEMTRRYLALKKWETARAELTKAFDLDRLVKKQNFNFYDPYEAELIRLDGIIDFYTGSFATAIQKLDRSLRKDISSLEAKYFRGRAYLAKGDIKHAKEDLKPLKEQNYQDAAALFNALTP